VVGEEIIVPSFSGVVQAAKRLKSIMEETPLVRSEPFSQITGVDVWLKLESASPIGSFKIRGAANALFKSKQFQTTKHAFAASSGNHGQGVAFTARRLGGTSCVYVPENPNLVKTAKMEALGARVVEQGAGFDEAREAALEACISADGAFVDDCNDPEAINGAGTVGYEIGRELDNLDCVFVPMGGGCLLSGTALAIKAIHPKTKVIGVQSAQAPAMHLSFQAKKPIEAEAKTHSEALSLRIPPALNLAQILQYVDSTELVEDDDLLRACKSMLLQGHQLAEPGSCAGLAALWRSREHLKGKTVVLVVSGANLDEPTMAKVMKSTLLF
jgi:threonine dehydratase